jgi:hypothetical protein
MCSLPNIRKSLAEIAKLRDLDCRRAAAERARSNLSRYFSPNVVEMLALSPRAPTCSITFSNPPRGSLGGASTTGGGEPFN